MFILANSDGRFILLRCCECGETVLIEKDKFKSISTDYVILKNDVKITCEKCGISHPKEDRYIPLEPQIIHEEYLQSPSSNLPFWMTRDVTTEEILGAIIYD